MGPVDNILKGYKKADADTRLDEFMENRDLRDDFSVIDALEDGFRAPPSSPMNGVVEGGPIPQYPPRG